MKLEYDNIEVLTKEELNGKALENRFSDTVRKIALRNRYYSTDEKEFSFELKNLLLTWLMSDNLLRTFGEVVDEGFLFPEIEDRFIYDIYNDAAAPPVSVGGNITALAVGLQGEISVHWKNINNYAYGQGGYVDSKNNLVNLENDSLGIYELLTQDEYKQKFRILFNMTALEMHCYMAFLDIIDSNSSYSKSIVSFLSLDTDDDFIGSLAEETIERNIRRRNKSNLSALLADTNRIFPKTNFQKFMNTQNEDSCNKDSDSKEIEILADTIADYQMKKSTEFWANAMGYDRITHVTMFLDHSNTKLFKWMIFFTFPGHELFGKGKFSSLSEDVNNELKGLLNYSKPFYGLDMSVLIMLNEWIEHCEKNGYVPFKLFSNINQAYEMNEHMKKAHEWLWLNTKESA